MVVMVTITEGGGLRFGYGMGDTDDGGCKIREKGRKVLRIDLGTCRYIPSCFRCNLTYLS